jgi:hypothetical protein
MNAMKARALRKKIYGDLSLKIERKYDAKQTGDKVFTKSGRGFGVTVSNQAGTPRAQYQKAKRQAVR